MVDAEEALAATSRKRPDLVLMDIELHGRAAGIEVAEAIRRSCNLPVVFLTAYTNEDLMQRPRGRCVWVLSKPFRVEDLNAAILIALQQYKMGQEMFAEHSWLVTMLASLSDGVIAGDTAGCVRYMKPAAEEMTPWFSVDALGKPIEEVYPLTHLDGSDVPQCQLRRARAAKKRIPKERFFMHVKSDDKIPLEDSAAPIIEGGHLLGAVTIFLNITARLQAEAEQQREQGRLKEEVRTISAALGQTREELRALSGRLVTAQEDERRRVARELHDDLGQRAALMGWRVVEMSKLSETLPAKLQQEVDELQTDLNYFLQGSAKFPIGCTQPPSRIWAFRQLSAH